MAPQSTILITGGTGSLGSAVARTLETSYPGRFYLLLTCRNPSDEFATSLSEFLRSKNGAFSFEVLDLSDLGAVSAFTASVKSRIAKGELPGLVGGGLVCSAAYQTFFKGRKGKEGKDIMYTVNCLSEVLLMRGLLEVLLDGGTVVNIGSTAHEIGKVEYFEKQGEGKEGEKAIIYGGHEEVWEFEEVGAYGGVCFPEARFSGEFPIVGCLLGWDGWKERADVRRSFLRIRFMSSISIQVP